jgi:hypothetical protein
MTFPTFSAGEVLRAADMNAVGLWLTKTQAVGASAVSSVDVTSCFSADYDNYVIAFNGISVSTNMSVLFSLLSGSTPTSSGWVSTEFYTAVGGTGLTGQLSNGAGASSFCSAATSASSLASVMEIQSPFLAQYTHFQYSVTDSAFYRFGFALHQASTSYNGFRVTASSGATMQNGSISVYGRKK